MTWADPDARRLAADAADGSIDGPAEPDWTAAERRRVLLLLAAATAIGSTGLAAGGTAGALLAADITGSNAAAGLPLGLLVIGSAAGALLLAAAAARGRRGPGLVLGYCVGACGAGIVIAAAVQRSMQLVLAGSLALGTANSAIFLTRYAAAATAADPSRRGRALGAVFFATAVGAVLSSALLGPSGSLAEAVGLPRLAGLYLVSVIAFGCSGMLLALSSRRQTARWGRGWLELNRGRTEQSPARAELLAGLRDGRARLALLGLAATNFVMVAIMTIAPIHLMSRGTQLAAVGVVVAVHVAGMFAPSPVSGYLADRIGAPVVLLAGLSLLSGAGLVGAAGSDSMSAMVVQLVLLGVGWNLGVVGASTLLGTVVPSALHPHMEGVGEVLMGCAAAIAAPVAGVLAALGSYRALSLAGAAVSVAGLYVAVRARRDSPGRAFG